MPATTTPPPCQVLLPAVVPATSSTASPRAARRPDADAAAAAAPAPGASAPAAGAGLLRYEVAVVTSDVRDAGTDARVWVLLEGSKGRSGWTRLEASPDNVRPVTGGGSGGGRGCTAGWCW